LDIAVQPILGADGRAERLLAVSRDITEQKRAELAAAEDARAAALRADIASAVARSGECGPLLQEITEILVRRVDAAFARIWIFRPETALLELQASAGMYTHLNGAHARIKVGEFKIGRIAANQKPHFTNEVLNDQEISDPKWAEREGMIAFAGYPLLFQERLLGVVALFAKHALEPRVVQELGLTADVVAQFIDRKNGEEDRSRLYQEATTARNDAVAASRAKDDFLAALSHELRTPLNPVLLLASEGANDASLPDPVRETFRTICNNVNLEARLIDDLLDLTRIARGKLALEMRPTDIHAVLREAIGIVSPEIEEKEIGLELKLQAQRVTVIGDAVRLQQVFWNVLKNAVKFTPRGGQIAVDTIVCDATEKLKVRITDSGIGLLDGDRERIFDAFSQGEHRKGGLGLGLTITRRLLENLGGSITASSPGPGKGSTFEVELPLAGTIAHRHEAGRDGKEGRDGVDGHALIELQHVKLRERAAPTPDSVARRKILLIEDHSATRTALQALLRRRKFEVITAACVEEARELAASAKPDIVISDLGLPDGDGCTLFSELRAAQPKLIGVALSGYGMDDDVARSLAAGFATHLTKPIDMNALARAIAALSPAVD
jgi:signal transduction histidine kinase